MKPCKIPCPNCPFRKDKSMQKGWLGGERMEQIVKDAVLGDSPFACHKTLVDGEIDDAKSKVCAGSLLLKKVIRPMGSVYDRTMVAFGYMQADYSDIKGGEFVFDNVVELVNFHKNQYDAD